MQSSQLYIPITLIFATAVQAINFAVPILIIINYKHWDELSPSTTSSNLDYILGTVIYIFVAAVLSVLTLTYLIINFYCKCASSFVITAALTSIVLMLQFAIGVSFASFLQNNAGKFQQMISEIDTLTRYGVIFPSPYINSIRILSLIQINSSLSTKLWSPHLFSPSS